MTTEDIMRIVGIAAKAALDTPAGQKLLADLEEEALKAMPGAAGFLLRTLAALAPHDALSIGFKKDGPG